MQAIYDFLFNTKEGVVLLFILIAIIFTIIAYFLEKRTRQLYVDRGPKDPDEDDDDWGLFDFDDDDSDDN